MEIRRPVYEIEFIKNHCNRHKFKFILSGVKYNANFVADNFYCNFKDENTYDIIIESLEKPKGKFILENATELIYTDKDISSTNKLADIADKSKKKPVFHCLLRHSDGNMTRVIIICELIS